MKIERIEISAAEVKPHGWVFWATLYCCDMIRAGLSPGKENAIPNRLNVKFEHHYGFVTAGHAIGMMMKKCKRMGMKFTADASVRWKSHEGTDDTFNEIMKNGEVDSERMNAIVVQQAKILRVIAHLPYPPEEKDDETPAEMPKEV